KLTSRLIEKRCRNFTLDFTLPTSFGKPNVVTSRMVARTPAIPYREYTNPNCARRNPPRKKPAPLRAFFDPVRIATHLKSLDCAFSGTRYLMPLLALIFVRSFAIPDN